ncbi:FAD/NAD(P)-binding domain-containing protein [Neurospora tetrasperma FGSC 2509]|nr:FAD/NAD(P)-binding domain-containing protein [Neurospora tetrasperma FGSC 2509]
MDALASQPGPVCSSTTRLAESQRQQLKVAIIGGGICGLALAVGLSGCRHIDFHIYEKMAIYRDVGAGLSLHKNAIAAMYLIDPELVKAYQKKAVKIGQEDQEMATEVILAAGRHKGLKVGELGRARGRKSVSRADLLDGFLEQVPRENISFGKQVVRVWETHPGTERSSTDSVAPYSEDSAEYDHPIHIEFADGTRAHADVLIGCDGIHSSVRSYILGEDHPATKPKNHNGWQIYRTLIPTEVAIEQWGVDAKLTRTVPILLGPNGHINIIPMKKGQMLSAGVAVRGAARLNTAFGPSTVPVSAPISPSTAPLSPPESESGIVPWVWYAALHNTTIGDFITHHTRPSSHENSPQAHPVYQTQPSNSLPGQGTPVIKPYLYGDYTREAQKIVRMVAADTSASWAVADHDHAPYYARGCVAMAGDAAHAALPFAGNGAAQALEDAAVLAHLFRTYVRTPEMAETALWAYEKVRMERSQRVVEIAREYGRVYSFNPIQYRGKWVKLHEKPEVMMQWFRQQAAYTNEHDVAFQNTWAGRLFVMELTRKKEARKRSEGAEGSSTDTHPKTKTDEVKSEEISNVRTMGEGTSPRSTWVSLVALRGREQGGRVEGREAAVMDGEDGERVERDEANDDDDTHDVESVASLGQDSDYDFFDDFSDDADDELEDEDEDGPGF